MKPVPDAAIREIVTVVVTSLYPDGVRAGHLFRTLGGLHPSITPAKVWSVMRALASDPVLVRCPRGGRPTTTRDVGDFAERHRKGGKTTWKGIAAAWRKAHPDEEREVTSEFVRGAWRRHHGDMARRPRGQ